MHDPVSTLRLTGRPAPAPLSLNQLQLVHIQSLVIVSCCPPLPSLISPCSLEFSGSPPHILHFWYCPAAARLQSGFRSSFAAVTAPAIAAILWRLDLSGQLASFAACSFWIHLRQTVRPDSPIYFANLGLELCSSDSSRRFGLFDGSSFVRRPVSQEREQAFRSIPF